MPASLPSAASVASTSISASKLGWRADSWRTRHAAQAVEYPDSAALQTSLSELRRRPPLVTPEEVARLRERLAEVAAGRAFLLQGGDCAEAFADVGTEAVESTLRVMLQMAVVLTFAAKVPVLKVGRIAGQYAKPRSSATETQDGVTLPSYRGDIVNGAAFDSAARAPDPHRLLQAHSRSAMTLNELRALTQGGYADLHEVHRWTLDFVRGTDAGRRYEALADRIGETIAFMNACGLRADNTPQLREVEFYTSHEALHLDYEEALARPVRRGADPQSGDTRWYGSAAHLLWLGERTRAIDGAHVEFLRGIDNPVGVKIGPKASPADVIALIDALNPADEAGRIVLIARMGAGQVAKALPPIVQEVARRGRQVVWCCDPMHGNTVTTAGGVKTRDFAAILEEVTRYFEVHRAAGTWPGGVHVEMTGQDVTECTGGVQNLTEDDLAGRYTTACDPRLNGSQSLELAFRVAELLKG